MDDPTKQADAAPPADSAPSGAVDVDAILAKVKIDPKFQAIYDKATLNGLRIMFGKTTHPMMEQELAKPGALPDKIAAGIVGLIYLLWTGSNKTLPPQLIVPLAFTFTLKAFDFLQKANDPEATKEVLGEAIEKSLTAVMQKFGVSPDQLPKILAQMKGSVAGAPAPVTGMLAQGGGSNG